MKYVRKNRNSWRVVSTKHGVDKTFKFERDAIELSEKLQKRNKPIPKNKRGEAIELINLGITLVKVAEYLRVSNGTVSRWYSNYLGVKEGDTVVKISKV